MLVKRLAIIGLGLIGGSMGLALKKSGIQEIIGIDLDDDTISGAPLIGAVDWATKDFVHAIPQADMVMVATPVGQIPQIFQMIAPYLSPNTLVTDVGSSKSNLAVAAQKYLPSNVIYIGGHPMAGSEQGGIAAAHSYLFENAYYILTPQNSQEPMLEKLKEVVLAIGAKPIILDPFEHDQVVAVISHMPHLIASALVNTLDELAHGQGVFYSLAAGGFRDTTRIAAGDPHLWRDIFFSNKVALLETVNAFERELALFKKILMEEDNDNMVDSLARARKVRHAIPQRGKGILAPLNDIVVSLVDEPGAIGKVAFLLAEEGINIVDIEILRVREGEGGTLRLGLPSSLDVQKAIIVLRGAGFFAQER